MWLAIAFTIPLACTLGEEDEGGPAPQGNSGTASSDAGPDANGECSPNSNDDACSACLKASCCAQWSVCRADTGCTTCSDCLAKEMNLETCNTGTCQFEGTEDPTAKLLVCGFAPCEMECGFS